MPKTPHSSWKWSSLSGSVVSIACVIAPWFERRPAVRPQMGMASETVEAGRAVFYTQAVGLATIPASLFRQALDEAVHLAARLGLVADRRGGLADGRRGGRGEGAPQLLEFPKLLRAALGRGRRRRRRGGAALARLGRNQGFQNLGATRQKSARAGGADPARPVGLLGNRPAQDYEGEAGEDDAAAGAEQQAERAIHRRERALLDPAGHRHGQQREDDQADDEENSAGGDLCEQRGRDVF